MECVIYKIENLVNGMVYVGQTVVGFKTRTGAHKSALKHNKHNNEYLQRAWNKYGKENFSFSVILECDTFKLDELEREWISYYRNFKGSYNLESGGNKLKKHSEISKKKMSLKSIENLSKPEVRAKLAKHWVNSRGSGSPVARKVICVNTGEIFGCMKDAGEKFNLSKQDISRVCKGERKSAGFHTTGIALQFSFYDEYSIYELSNILNLHERRRVVCTNTKEVFETGRAGAKKYNLSQSSISQCCNGKIKSAGRLPNGEYSVWVYEDDYDPNKDYYFHRHLGKHNPRAKKVICLTTNKIFDTMEEAGKHYGMKNPCKISLSCTGKRKHVGSLPDGTKLKWSYL